MLRKMVIDYSQKFQKNFLVNKFRFEDFCCAINFIGKFLEIILSNFRTFIPRIGRLDSYIRTIILSIGTTIFQMSTIVRQMGKPVSEMGMLTSKTRSLYQRTRTIIPKMIKSMPEIRKLMPQMRILILQMSTLLSELTTLIRELRTLGGGYFLVPSQQIVCISMNYKISK